MEYYNSTMSKKNRRTSKLDRISELPVHIKLLILSHLPTHEAMMTTILSRQWRDVWIGLPSLDLSEQLFYGRIKRRVQVILPYIDWNEAQVSDELIKQFLEFIELAMQKRCKTNMRYVQRLNLYLPKLDITSELSDVFDALNRWMKLAILELKVDELKLRNNIDFQELKWGRVLANVSIPSALKRLSLKNVVLVPDIIELLDKSCPSIEKLSLVECSKLDSLKVSGMRKLTEFKFKSVDRKFSKLIVDVPILRSLRFVCDYYYARIDVAACKCLKRLEICKGKLELDKHSEVLEKLEDLVLHSVFVDEPYLRISSSNLQSLNLKKYGKVEVNAPNLKYLKLGYIKPSDFDMTSSGLNSIKLISYRTFPGDQISWAKVLEFLRKFRFCEEVKFLGTFKRKSNEEMEAIVLNARNSPVYDIQHITTESSYVTFAVDEMVDTLLQFCPRLSTLSMRSGRTPRKDLKLKYHSESHTNNSMKMLKCSRCEDFPVRCWQHELQEVTIVNHEINGELDEDDLEEVRRAIVRDDAKLEALFGNPINRQKILVNFVNNIGMHEGK